MLLLNKRFYKSKNLLILTLIMFVVLPTLILFSYIYIKNIQFLNEKLETNTSVFTNQLSNNLESNIEELTAFINMAANDQLVMQTLVKSNFLEKGYERKKTYDSLTNLFSNMSRFNHSNLYNVLLIPADQKGFYFYKTYNADEKDTMHMQSWYQETAAQKGKINWIGVVPADNSSKDRILAASKAVIDLNTYEVTGVLYFEFFLSNFELFSNPELEQQFLAVSDGNGAFIHKTRGFQQLLSMDQENIFADISFGNYEKIPKTLYLLAKEEIPVTGWEVLNVVPKETYGRDMLKIAGISVALFLVCIGIYLVYLGILQRNFTVPLQSLVNLFNEIESGNSNINFSQFSCYEILKLSKGAITLIEKKKSTDKELKNSLEKQDMLNMDMLRAKMNPHFIYNVLNTVKYRALTHGQNDIANILNSLIKLLKGSISRNGDYSTLEEELVLVQDYVTIQQEIYEHPIGLENEIGEDAKKCIIPAMLLQPLIENSILHGFDIHDNHNLIRINAEKKNQLLCIKVGDNGRGMPPQKAQALEAGVGERMSNLGLPGVIDRIRLIYGTQGDVKVYSTLYRGTEIEITIPVKLDTILKVKEEL